VEFLGLWVGVVAQIASAHIPAFQIQCIQLNFGFPYKHYYYYLDLVPPPDLSSARSLERQRKGKAKSELEKRNPLLCQRAYQAIYLTLESPNQASGTSADAIVTTSDTKLKIYYAA
jgi:hypothetical protein